MGAIKDFYSDKIEAGLRTWSKMELSNLNAFDLWNMAALNSVRDYQHLRRDELIEAILEKQETEITRL
jgi:hypothetical protein